MHAMNNHLNQEMAHFVSQTQDCPPFSSQEESLKKLKRCLLESMEHSELCAIDPEKNLFSNEQLGVFANKESVRFINHLLHSSQHVTKLRSHVSKHGFLLKHDAAEVIHDLVLHHLHPSNDEHVEGPPDSHLENDAEDLVPAHSRCHCNWALGVLLYALMCGPPPNNHSKKYIDFYNEIGLGVIVVPSKWFGSPQKRRKWSQLDVESKVFILKLVHTESKVYEDAFSEDTQWSELLLQNGWSTDRSLFEEPGPVLKKHQGSKIRDPPPAASIDCKTPTCKEKSPLVEVRAHHRKMPSSVSKGKKKCVIKGDRAMDVASFREILRIHRLDNDEFSQNRDTCHHRQKTSDEWNGFWSKAAKVERKKKRKPLTVVQSKEKKKKKLRSEIIRRLNDFKKPVCHLFENPDLHL